MSVDSLANGWTKALSVERKHSSIFFEKMMDGFAYHKVVVDKSGKPIDYVFLEVNNAFEKMIGLKKEEIIGKKVTEILKGIENDPADWIGTYGKVALNCESIQFENYAKPLDKWYNISAYCPEKGYFVTLFEDVTERKKAEKEIARLATFPTLNPNPVFEVDFKGKLTYANPATTLFFPDIEELGLKHPLLSNWEDIAKDYAQKIKTTTSGREIKVNEHWYHEQIYLVPETQQVRVYTVDIDELKLVEEERVKAQIKLEENAILLEEYANQMEELANQRAAQLKDAERMAAIGQTAGMVGHDIRNPLQAITSDMYLITEETKSMKEGESKQAILESIESVNENITYIDKIVSDLQDYTRPLKPNLQVINLSELIQSTILAINIPNRIELITKLKENSAIKTDTAYLRRILTNLITNAVQAMPNEGKLTVKINRKKDKTAISIQDTGLGIPENVKTKMFTPLFTTKSKGQGLGLAVVKRLVEALNGKIHFESQVNKGTKFTVELSQNE